MTNHLKTLFFLVLLSSFFMLFGYLFGGQTGLIFGFVFAIITNFISYWFSDSIVLSMHHAEPVYPGDELGLYHVVERLARNANIPTPRVFIIPDHSPNAFATGRNPYHSAVAVTQGLIGALSGKELEGVIAHELAHIKNRDTLISCVAATFASAIMFMANSIRWMALFGGASSRDEEDNHGGAFGLIIMSVLAPIAATLVQMAISRSREYAADAEGARICGKPEWLASALQKIHAMSTRTTTEVGAPATAHLYIVNPFSGSALLNLFSTHPPIEERVSLLLKMETKYER